MAFNLSKLTGAPVLKSTELNLGSPSHVDTKTLSKFRPLLEAKFRNPGGETFGCVVVEAGPIWSLRGKEEERLLLYQIGNSFYALIHFASKFYKGINVYKKILGRMVAVFLFYQYGI
jgi:hypothetical protein